jgi:hypothetical protein
MNMNEDKEPKRTIFEDIKDFNFNRDVTRILMFNSYFKDMGFERVNNNKEFSIYTYYPQLTLMINPALVLQEDRNIETGEEFNCFTSDYINSRRSDTTYDLWDNYLKGKKGYLGLRSHYIIKRRNEEVKPIKIEFQDKELILGHYIKERNIVLLYISPFYTNYSEENNEYLELMLKVFQEKMKDIKLEKVDVAEKMKNAFIEKFKETINNKLKEIKGNLKYGEDEINNLQVSLLRAIRNSQLNRKQIEGLVAFSTNTDTTIKKAIEELKQLPFVSNIRLMSGGIYLDVGRISINHNDEEVYIGDFYLIISPDGVKVYCKNPILNLEGIETSHPHIDGNHNCYGGEREQKILEYLSTFDLKRLVYFIYMFLKTYTANDCYNSLPMWSRQDLKRRNPEEVKDEEDFSKADFKGDYYQEPSDRGRHEAHEDDDDDSDEEENDDYIGDCHNCGDSIYESSEYYITDGDDYFCGQSCKDEHDDNENRDDNE